MNKLVIGFAEKDLSNVAGGFLLIDDKELDLPLFDVHQHSFNPVKGMSVQAARDFATALYGQKDLMTYRDGKRALVKMLLAGKRLDKLPAVNHKGYEDARDTIDDVLMSDVVRRVLCNPTNFSFKPNKKIYARINRAELGDQDALILAHLLIGQFQGQIIVPDFGFYGRDFHTSLILQNRLIAGVNTLTELSDTLRQTLLGHIKDIHGHQATYEDALTIARYKGYDPQTVRHTEFIHGAMA